MTIEDPKVSVFIGASSCCVGCLFNREIQINCGTVHVRKWRKRNERVTPVSSSVESSDGLVLAVSLNGAKTMSI